MSERLRRIRIVSPNTLFAAIDVEVPKINLNMNPAVRQMSSAPRFWFHTYCFSSSVPCSTNQASDNSYALNTRSSRAALHNVEPKLLLSDIRTVYFEHADVVHSLKMELHSV
ncbi:hypothetical protein FGIG_01186 [Fasciola gigantica]|uniref:Uncharacterized protein n=1 Tax=Fasciola gigantica TaxID=46835 RepID=A0A504Z3S1_FASGI|nr:hypothetical protein FGIG_01186 [Fasciola gigantica]